MTIETRATIQLGDVLAVEYRCRTCQAKAVRPLAHFDENGEGRPHRVPIACGNCGAAWMMDLSSSDKGLETMFNLVAFFADPNHKMPFDLRLEVCGLAPFAGVKRDEREVEP
jgi:hypothetical protein